MTRTLSHGDRQLCAEIGARIKRRRRLRKLDAATLARLAGVHPNTVYWVEKGRGIEVVTLMKLLPVLGCGPEELLGGLKTCAQDVVSGSLRTRKSC